MSDSCSVFHRVVRFSSIPEPLFNRKETKEEKEDLIKKFIGYVRTVPPEGAPSPPTDFYCGTNVHWMLSKNFSLYSPGSNNCWNTRCHSHGFYVSKKCEAEDPMYEILKSEDASDWNKVIAYLEKNGFQNKTDKELCLCVKINTQQIKPSDEYWLTEIDEDHFSLENSDPCELQYITEVGSKFDCFLLPNIGLKYEWEPCCFKWRRINRPVKRSTIDQLKLTDKKLLFVYDALLFMQFSGDECAQQVIVSMFDCEKFDDIFDKLDQDVQDFIKSAVEYYDKENDFYEGENFSYEICEDFDRRAENKKEGRNKLYQN